MQLVAFQAVLNAHFPGPHRPTCSNNINDNSQVSVMSILPGMSILPVMSILPASAS